MFNVKWNFKLVVQSEYLWVYLKKLKKFTLKPSININFDMFYCQKLIQNVLQGNISRF